MSDTADVLTVLAAQQAEHTPHMPDAEQPAAGEWMPGGQVTEWPDIRGHILAKMAQNPRGLQKTIGPSELGTTCLHCLTRKLVSDEQPQGDTAWLPFIGTAVHERFEHMFGIGVNVEPERRVTVATLHDPRPPYRPMTITGSIDLWDPQAGATIDWKIVGNSTLDQVRRHGPSQKYKIQASLYGIGMDNEKPGIMRRSCIYFLPRNQPSLDAAVVYETDFDPHPGMWALERAQLILSLYATITAEYGPEVAGQWADAMPRDPSHCFTCRDQLGTPVTLDTFGAEHTPWPVETDLADSLPDMPRALLKVPQAEYRPCTTNNQPTTNNQ